MWRRLISSNLKKTLSTSSTPSTTTVATSSSYRSLSHIKPTTPFYSSPRFFSTQSENAVSGSKKSVEDVMPIATGHELEELQAELQGKDILEINYPVGPFGTKESPAVIKSYFDMRIVGCPGVEGEDEHDVVWFRLWKDHPVECPVCGQYFELEVVGPGGDPEGHTDDEGHHH